MLIAIWAQDNNGLIGNDGRLPWHLPNDLKFFKNQTTSHDVVMGRKTFAGMDYKALPNRENYILTRQVDSFNGMDLADNVHLTDDTAEIVGRGLVEDVYITGGKEVFAIFWPHIDELRVTKIEGEFEGDTIFTPDLSDFEVYDSQAGIVDDKNKYDHTFYFYRRRK